MLTDTGEQHNHDLIHMVIFMWHILRAAQNYAMKINLQVHWLFQKQNARSWNEFNALNRRF